MLVIAIDGPVAAGKTTIGRLIAQELDAIPFDTGLLYRATAWRVLQAGVDPADQPAVAAVARETRLDVRSPTVDDGRTQDLILDGEDVTWALRSPEIDRALPDVSANPGVREALLEEQRRIASSGRVVMIGRDMGTVIVPDTPHKFYLDAPIEERAKRRYAELIERGVEVTFESVRTDLQARDERDSSREASPLRPADDAVVINTADGSAEEIAHRIVACVNKRQSESSEPAGESQ